MVGKLRKQVDRALENLRRVEQERDNLQDVLRDSHSGCKVCTQNALIQAEKKQAEYRMQVLPKQAALARKKIEKRKKRNTRETLTAAIEAFRCFEVGGSEAEPEISMEKAEADVGKSEGEASATQSRLPLSKFDLNYWSPNALRGAVVFWPKINSYGRINNMADRPPGHEACFQVGTLSLETGEFLLSGQTEVRERE